MKYCRFLLNGQAQYGLVEPVAGREAIVRILLSAPEESDGDVEGLRTRRIEPIALEEAGLLAPVRPSKIVCVGRNYREHAAELGHARRRAGYARNQAVGGLHRLAQGRLGGGRSGDQGQR